MKILLIVFGSLFGLMVIAIIGIAIMIPILGKKMIADSNDPVARARTIAKIAHFTVPPGYRIRTASDLGISQSATLVPVRSDASRTVIQLTGQHFTASDPNASLDAMSTGFTLTAKLMHCDLTRGEDDKITAAGKTLSLRTYGCGPAGSMHTEIGFVVAKASRVQVMATSMNGPLDKTALDELVASIR